MLYITDKTGLDFLKTAGKCGAHKSAEATDKFTGSKITVKTVKSKLFPAQSSGYFEEIVIPPEEREEILN